MHESSLLADLLRMVNDLAKEAHATRVAIVRVKLGALAHITPDHLREHFVIAVRNTNLEGALLEIEELKDINHDHATEIILDSIDVV
jgi:hydrogenase nickel incorporation protein HypA/HybF